MQTAKKYSGIILLLNCMAFVHIDSNQPSFIVAVNDSTASYWTFTEITPNLVSSSSKPSTVDCDAISIVHKLITVAPLPDEHKTQLGS